MLPSAVPPLAPQSHCTDAYLLGGGGWWGIGGWGSFGSVKGFKISPQFFVSKGKEGDYIFWRLCAFRIAEITSTCYFKTMLFLFRIIIFSYYSVPALFNVRTFVKVARATDCAYFRWELMLYFFSSHHAILLF